MDDSGKCVKTSYRNKRNNSRSTPENPVSTSKVSTPQERIDIRIPKKSKIYQYLYVDTEGDARANWERLDALLSIAENNDEKYCSRLFEDFITRIGEIYPTKVEKLKKLRALILWHILWGEDLDETYWKKLREL